MLRQDQLPVGLRFSTSRCDSDCLVHEAVIGASELEPGIVKVTLGPEPGAYAAVVCETLHGYQLVPVDLEGVDALIAELTRVREHLAAR